MWIDHVREADATGAIADLYRRGRQRRGWVNDADRAFSLRPEVGEARDTMRDLLSGEFSMLGERRADMINTVVSGLNRCTFCGNAHAGILFRKGFVEEGDAVELYIDWRSVDLAPDDRAMLQFAEKLTSAPWSMTERDVEELREVGFDDCAIFDIASVTAYRGFINRIFAALGVEAVACETRLSERNIERVLHTRQDDPGSVSPA